MKRLVTFVFFLVVAGTTIICVGILYLRFAAPAKLIAIAQRNGGWVDDNIPLRRIRIDNSITDADRQVLTANLPRVGKMLEISVARNSGDARWIRERIDLSEMQSVSIDGSSEGSTLTEMLGLINASPKLTEIKIYNSRASVEEIAGVKRVCSTKGIALSNYP